jgi:hypothetical protein
MLGTMVGPQVMLWLQDVIRGRQLASLKTAILADLARLSV